MAVELAQLGLIALVLAAVLYRRRRERDRDDDINELHGRVDVIAGRVGELARFAAWTSETPEPSEPEPAWHPPPGDAKKNAPLSKQTQAMRTDQIDAARAEGARLAAESDAHKPVDDEARLQAWVEAGSTSPPRKQR